MERLHARGEQELNLALNELGVLEARVGESHRWIESAKAALEGSSCREPAELVALMGDGRRLGLALPEMQQLAQSLKESEWAEQAQAAVDEACARSRCSRRSPEDARKMSRTRPRRRPSRCSRRSRSRRSTSRRGGCPPWPRRSPQRWRAGASGRPSSSARWRRRIGPRCATRRRWCPRRGGGCRPERGPRSADITPYCAGA